MVECIIPKICVFVSICSIENNPIQQVVMTFGQDLIAIYLNSSSGGIVVAHSISMKFGIYQIHLYVSLWSIKYIYVISTIKHKLDSYKNALSQYGSGM